jgi:hypothetical protein
MNEEIITEYKGFRITREKIDRGSLMADKRAGRQRNYFLYKIDNTSYRLGATIEQSRNEEDTIIKNAQYTIDKILCKKNGQNTK